MSEVRDLIEQLVEAGIDPVQAAEVVTRAAIHGAANAPRQRSAGAIRQERYRRNKASQVTESDACDGSETVSLDKEIPPDPQKKLNPSPKEKDPKGSQKKRVGQSELESVLDTDTARAVVEHRQKIRKPLTPRAAELLSREFSKCPDPVAGAEAMIANGWQGFKPEWLSNQNQTRGSPPNKRDTPADAARRRIEALHDERHRSETDNHQSAPRLVSSDGQRFG